MAWVHDDYLAREPLVGLPPKLAAIDRGIRRHGNGEGIEIRCLSGATKG